ncbi:PQQ-dependent sugar dehydrogenase [Adhaeribacter pallidiroseus]|uniref:Soluble aldose sugar dehydrogenase YliI n=1 Tax=Adhaeribacter pallidiroseus TaxID=2072847 RepID=A0A369QGR2_9BACT|nr:PQQ-dependent sugar dehydrogenase [Adhaeribacter pallidiroseus]RDC62457.1 Soluble aldose sugar dehydrogenase YliI [Adhaeribacter pallidiroseus]
MTFSTLLSTLKGKKNLFYLILFLISSQTLAQNLPTGFSRVQVAAGISKPTTMTFAPDGRIFVAQQNGNLRIIKNGKLLTTPFMQLPVTPEGERGLIGLVLDPNFASNNFLYVYYTLPDASHNRISRFTANGDQVVPGSEVVVLDLDPLSSATNHNGGAMHFRNDGKLYVAVGDNANSANSQNKDTYHGKLLRINTNGSVPSGNPFPTGSAQQKRIWALGLRNPFTFSVQPGTGKMFVNDVGQITWEEINNATTGGKNFGWPITEGVSTNPNYVNPVYTYSRNFSAEDGTGCAITGGVFFNPTTTNYPAAYWGKYFFQDYCSKWINFLDFSGGTVKRKPFATGLGASALGLTVGNDGNLYYLERTTSAVFKIIYTTNTAPEIVQQPKSISVPAGQPATYSVTVTGQTPLTFQWQKNNANISGATAATYTIASTKPTDAGNYRVLVKNAVGSVTSSSVALTVTAFNSPPIAIINTPAANSLYRGGQTILFSGEATDKEDGTLPASAFTWSVDFHHDTHTHDGPPIAAGVKSGSFTIPTSGEVSANVWYELSVTVKDSKGLTHTVSRDIHPYTSTITLATQPAGLKVTMDGQPFTAPHTETSVEGIARSLGPVDNQTLNGKTYVFEKWQHGGAANQTIATPQNNATYTAVYRDISTTYKLEAEEALLKGAQVSAKNAGFSGKGFADFINESDDYVEFTVYVPTAGSYNLKVQYALNQGTRNLRLQVNEKVISADLAFTATGQWTNWAGKSVNAPLTAGTNKVRLTATGTSGPNLDYLEVTPSTSASAIDLRIYPNPARSYVTIDLPAAWDASSVLTLYNNQGQPVYTTAGDHKNQITKTVKIPVENLPRGLYILKMQQGLAEISEQVILEK